MEEPNKDPFTPESVEVQVGQERLSIRPLPFKKFREALAVVRTAFAEAQAAAEANPMAIVDDVPQLLMGKFSELAPILFSRSDLGRDWFDENVSVPLARHCLEQAARVNGVGDFLGYLRKATAQPKPE